MFFTFISYVGICKPYSQQACIDAGKVLGLIVGGNGYRFAGNYGIKGCYAYHGGIFHGRIYYGTGGNKEEMQSAVHYPKYRPTGYDCSANGIKIVNKNIVLVKHPGI